MIIKLLIHWPIFKVKFAFISHLDDLIVKWNSSTFSEISRSYVLLKNGLDSNKTNNFEIRNDFYETYNIYRVCLYSVRVRWRRKGSDYNYTQSGVDTRKSCWDCVVKKRSFPVCGCKICWTTIWKISF